MAASTSSRVCSSSMFLMKWNGIMESFLIDEVENLPYLWEIFSLIDWHPHFTKRLKKNWISADRREDKREVAGTRSFLDASDEDFENVVELPPIPYSESQTEQPQRIRVFSSIPPVSTSIPWVSTSTPRAKKRKVDISHEAFYESMQKCLGAVGKKK
ncbi:hypothetical protein TNCV_3125701 [Trichonephila clavipes]|nr:hypothetical protein TNCV_3125701 [Trichonephila clavipes]